MKKPTQISKISTLLIILILTLSAILITVPLISGQAIPTKKTYAMCGVIPNPVGVNQQVLLLLDLVLLLCMRRFVLFYILEQLKLEKLLLA